MDTIIYKTSGVYIGDDIDDILKHLPDTFYKRFHFKQGKYFIEFSLIKKDGFNEYKKDNIREPNIEFINMIKNNLLYGKFKN